MQDKNPGETEDRIRNVLSTINSRFGGGKGGQANKDMETFAELLAIEAQYGDPLIKQDESLVEQTEKNPSQWAMFYEAISQKKKFS